MRFRKLVLSHRSILVASLFILFSTTIYWATLGAIVHNNNADQIIDPLLFSSTEIFQQAIFPSSHTFLIKWPLFAIIALFNNIQIAIIVATIILCLLTVGGLFYLIYRIEKRPLVLALLALILASVLLMVPIEPRPGSLLPANFAMLTTRNIEYVLFAIGVILLTKIGIRRSVFAVLLLTLLFASDRLFMYIGIGSSVIALLISYLSGHKNLLKTLYRTFIVMIVASLFSYGLLATINLTGITHIASDINGPYSLNTKISDQFRAVFYAILGIATNIGSNPIYDLNSWRDALNIIGQRATIFYTFAYAVNFSFLMILIYHGLRLIKILRQQSHKSKKYQITSNLSFLNLFFSSSAITASILFVSTVHYYPVDSRYLTIWLLAVAIFAPTCTLYLLNKIRIKSWIWPLLLLSIVCGIFSTLDQFQKSTETYSINVNSNNVINTALSKYRIKTLIGDYWRVTPIAASNPDQIAIIPLSSCFEQRSVLTSKAWSNNATNQSFAYLLNTVPTGTGFPSCSIKDVEKIYGTPDRKILLDEQLQNPSETLLIYEKGLNKNSKKPSDETKKLEDLDNVPCPKSTIMQIVAHQDDDLLFMNPDLLNSIKKNDCVRTVYLTAGDGGGGVKYWSEREKGAMAAYAIALGLGNPNWTVLSYRLTKNILIHVAHLKESNGSISLIFLRLPDGDSRGNGFDTNKKISLLKIFDGASVEIASVDGKSVYSKEDLLQTIVSLLKKYDPSELRTFDTTLVRGEISDHNDHITTGKLSLEAFDRYKLLGNKSHLAHLSVYEGYSVRNKPSNINYQDLEIKKKMFYKYAEFDGATCNSDEACYNTAYRYYLSRQYKTP